jgi:hypothetical protein
MAFKLNSFAPIPMKSCVSQYRIFFSCRDGSVEVDAEVIYSADPNNHTALYSNNPTVNKNVLVAETLRKKILEGRFKNYDLKTVRIQGTGGGVVYDSWIALSAG